MHKNKIPATANFDSKKVAKHPDISKFLPNRSLVDCLVISYLEETKVVRDYINTIIKYRYTVSKEKILKKETS